jgi:hypothetical protein
MAVSQVRAFTALSSGHDVSAATNPNSLLASSLTLILTLALFLFLWLCMLSLWSESRSRVKR